MGAAAAWTGSEMIVWGGSSQGTSFRLDGGRYNPTTNTWELMGSVDFDYGRIAAAGFYDGSHFFTWGGLHVLTTLDAGRMLDVATDSWTDWPTPGAPASRVFHSLVWTGSEMIIWGGTNFFTCGCGQADLSDGARYNLHSGTWTSLPASGAPTARGGHSAVWTGSEMIVWGGFGGGALADGGRYDLGSHTWTVLATNDLTPTARSGATAVWDGTDVVVWGGAAGFSWFSDGARFNPTTNAWLPLQTMDVPTGRTSHSAVWTGTQMIIWGGYNLGPGFLDDGGVWQP